MTTKHPEIFLVPEEKHQVFCNGGEGSLGHPKVYYTFDGQDEVVCGYCDRLFTKKKDVRCEGLQERRRLTNTAVEDVVNDDSLLQLYNRELMALSAQVTAPKSLAHPDAKATVVSVICGSEVTVELFLTGDKVEDFGYAVEACTLTKAVVAIMARAVPGKNRQEIARAGAELRAMMAGTAPPPAGDWAALKILTPVIEYKARHDTIMLPFEAIEKAFAERK